MKSFLTFFSNSNIYREVLLSIIPKMSNAKYKNNHHVKPYLHSLVSGQVIESIILKFSILLGQRYQGDPKIQRYQGTYNFKKMSVLLGKYEKVPVTIQDSEVFVLLTPQLEKISEDKGPFIVEKVWEQVVSGVNKFYNVKSRSNKKYSARIYYPLPSLGQKSSLTLFEVGWIDPTEHSSTFKVAQEPSLSAIRALTQMGGFNKHYPTSYDRVLIRKFANEIYSALGEPTLHSEGNIYIKAAWEQIVNGKNEFYHLKVGMKTLCSVNINVSFDGKQSEITYFGRGLIDPTANYPFVSSKDVLRHVIVGGFSKKQLDQGDLERVNHHSSDFQKDSGQLMASFTIDRAWQQIVNGQNLYYNLTSSSKTQYSTIVYVPFQGSSVVTFFVRGHYDPTQLSAADYKTELKERLSLGGYEKISSSKEDKERMNKLTPEFKKHIDEEHTNFSLKQAWVKTNQQESNFYYVLFEENHKKYYTTNIKITNGEAEKEQVTSFLSQIVLPGNHKQNHSISQDQRVILVGEFELEGIEDDRTEKISFITLPLFGGYSEIAVSQEGKEAINQLSALINELTGNKDQYTIVREWVKVVNGIIKYLWLEGSQKDQYSIGILFSSGLKDPIFIFFSQGFIDPTISSNSTSLTLRSVSNFDRYVIIIPKQEDLELVKKHTPQMLVLSGEPTGTTFKIILAAEKRLIGGTIKFYQLSSSTNKNYSVEIDVEVDGNSHLVHFYTNHIKPPIHIEKSNSVTISKDEFAKLLYGGFKKAEITPYDQQLILKHTEDLRALTNQNKPDFLINAVWTQIANGQNRYYWLTSNHGIQYSTLINVPPLSVHLQSKVVTIFSDHVDPNRRGPSLKANQEFGEYIPHVVNAHDKFLVNIHTPEMIKKVPSEFGPFLIKLASSQVVDGVNFKYVLESLTSKKYYEAVINESLKGQSSLISFTRLLRSNLDQAQFSGIIGGYQNHKVNDHDRQLVKFQTPEIIKSAGGNQFGPFHILNAQSQVVDGTNYRYILKSVSSNNNFVAIIYDPLDRPVSQSSLVSLKRLLKSGFSGSQQNIQEGQYIPHPVNSYDKSLVKVHTEEMIKASQDNGPFKILVAQRQSVNGVNNKYILSSNSTNNHFEAIIYTRLGEGADKSQLTSFARILTTNLSQKNSGEQKPHAITSHDYELVRWHHKEMVKLQGDKGPFEILKASRQIVNGTNYMYVLKSLSSRDNFSANIYEPLSKKVQESVLTSFKRLYLQRADNQFEKVDNGNDYTERRLTKEDIKIIGINTLELQRQTRNFGIFEPTRVWSKSEGYVMYEFYWLIGTNLTKYSAKFYSYFDTAQNSYILQQTFKGHINPNKLNLKVQAQTNQISSEQELPNPESGRQLKKELNKTATQELSPDISLSSIPNDTPTNFDKVIITAKTPQLNLMSKELTTYTINEVYRTIEIPTNLDILPVKFEYKLTSNLSKRRYTAVMSGSINLKVDQMTRDISSQELSQEEETLGRIGEITWRETRQEDRLIINQLKPDISKFTHKRNEDYTILSTWQEPVSAITNFYWLTDNSGDVYSLSMMQERSVTSKPTISSIRNGITKPSSNYKPQLLFNGKLPSIDLLGGYKLSQMSNQDKVLVKSLQSELEKATGSAKVDFNILCVWRQVVNGTNNFYWLEFNRTYYSVNIFASNKSGRPKITFFLDKITAPTQQSSINTVSASNSFSSLFSSGQFHNHETTVQDIARVQLMTPELRMKTGVANDKFKIIEAWSQVVSGENDFYWIQGRNEMVYSVSFYTHSGMTIHRPAITYFAEGMMPPTASKDSQLDLGQNQLGGYAIYEIKQKDLELIRFITPQLREELGQKEAFYGPVAAWRQILPESNMEYYWLQSSTFQEYSVTIIVPKSELMPAVSNHSKGFSYPNKNHLLSIQSEFPLGKDSWQPLSLRDIELLREKKSELNEKTGENDAIFTPISHWIKTNNPPESTYWLITGTGKTYTVVFQKEGQGFLITYCNHGLILPGLAPADYAAVNIKSLYWPDIITPTDKNFIKDSLDKLQLASGEKGATFEIDIAWLQTDTIGVNKFYWLKSSNEKRYSVNFWIVGPLGRYSSMTKFLPLWVNPNKV